MESSADIMIYRESLHRHDPGTPFTEQRIACINDLNSGSYNSTITIDTSPLNSSEQWADFRNSYLVIPYLVSMTASGGTGAFSVPPTFDSLVFKNGYFNAIDSIQVTSNGKTICQQTTNINQFVNAKLLTQFSQSELKKIGPSIGFYPDNAKTLTYLPGPTGAAIGYTNNVINPTGNYGAWVRSQTTMVAGTTGTTGTNGSISQNSYMFRNQYTGLTVSNNVNVYNWEYLLQIRLRDVLDYFDKVPIVKGMSYQFLITYNSFTQKVTLANGVIQSINNIQSSGNTVPVMIAGQGSIGAGYLASTGLTEITVSGGVKTNSLSNYSMPITQCRLYVPTYRIDPMHLANLIENNPITKVKYQDIYVYFTLRNIGQEFNQMITNSVPGRVRSVLVVPTVGQNCATVAAEAQSLLSSSPSTTLLNGAIKNFNVQIGGINVWMDNQQWDFCQYNDALVFINAIDGEQVPGLSSGLISFSDFEEAYRYYFADVTRLGNSIDSSNRSVSVRGNNYTDTLNTYIVFVSYDKTVNIETATGKIVD